MTKKRRAPNKDERIAASLLMIKKGEDWLIPEPIRSSGDTKKILAYVQWDHGVPDALGGGTGAGNIRPMTVADHAIKTKRDVKEIAKAKRLAKSHAEFRRKILAKSEPDVEVVQKTKHKAKIPSRPMAGGKKSPWKKTFNKGTVRRDETD
jgi:hypothetical protein